MDAASRAARGGYPPGLLRIANGECPLELTFCCTCPYGHMLECHYPMRCEEARCDHYLRETEEE